MGGRVGTITRLHAFPRPEQNITQQTLSGAIVTIVGTVTVITLFMHELSAFLTPTRDYKMSVDATPRGVKLPIHFDITFPAMPCLALSMNSVEGSGVLQMDLSGADILKVRLNREGRSLGAVRLSNFRNISQMDRDARGSLPVLGSGAGRHQGLRLVDFSELDKVALQIRAALTAQEGCRMSGQLEVERNAGSLQVMVHSQHYYVMKKVFPSNENINLSHRINMLGFGLLYPGIENPLDGARRTVLLPPSGANQSAPGPGGLAGVGRLSRDVFPMGDFKYFLKVVPTAYVDMAGKELFTNQYSVSEYFYSKEIGKKFGFPTIAFNYDISPIIVLIKEERKNFFHFLTRLCAVLGGAFALTGFLDRIVYTCVQQVLAMNGRQKLNPKNV